MPATIYFDDPSVVITPPGGHFEPLTLTLGPNKQQNDVRLVMVSGSGTSSDTTLMVPMSPDPPTGFTAAYVLDSGNETRGIYYRTIVNGDTDTSVAFPKPPGWRDFMYGLLTARGVDPSVAPTAGALTTTHTVGATTVDVSSVSVPAAGVMVFVVWNTADPEGGWPSWPTSMGTPTGWKPVMSTDKSGETYYQYDTNPAVIVIGKEYLSSGTTGTVSIPVGDGAPATAGMWFFLRKAPDSSSTGSAMTATASMTAGTSSSTTNPVSQGSPMVSTASMSTGFNPLAGYWISDPYPLNGAPVAASRVTFDLVVPDGATAVVETSINNGLSWDVAANYGPVPRLREGDTTTRTVLSRVTFTRQSALGGIPKVKSLKVRIGCTISSDELIPTFYGPVDKAKTKITPGSSGGTGGASSGAGSIGRGGGLVGGGAVVKVHATDPSRLIQLAEWEQVYTGPTGVTYDQLGKAMVLDRRPNQTLFNQFSSDHTVDDSLLVWGLGEGANPWQNIRGVYTSIGSECFYDVIGAFTSRPVPDPRRGAISWNWDHTIRPVIIGLESELDTSQIVNGWVIKGESTTSKNPVNAYAFNTDPASRYNIYPPPIGIGKRIKRKTFSLAKTVQQCQDIADGSLNNSLGLANTVTIGIVAHPGVALGDIARINSPETGVVGRFLIQGYQLMDSVADQMQLTCFRQTDNP